MADVYERIRTLRDRMKEADDPLMLAFDEWRQHGLDRFSRAQVWAALHPVEEAEPEPQPTVRERRGRR